MRDKITSLAIREAKRSLITPVIIEAKPNKLHGIVDEIVTNHILEESSIVGSLFPKLRMLKELNMFGCLLKRDNIFDLADNNDITRIYPDRFIRAFSLPTVSPISFPVRHGNRVKNIEANTTEQTKKLMGLDEKYNGNGIKIAIPDTGSIVTHEQTRRRVRISTVMPQARDENGHGTWCVTCIGGSQGIPERLIRKGIDSRCIGMAPLSELHAIKCLGFLIGTGTTSGTLRAIELAILKNVDIISMSMGIQTEEQEPDDSPYFQAMKRADKKGIICVAAAGNEGPDEKTINMPGALDTVLTVGAYNQMTGEMANFSSRGPTPWNDTKPDCVAPGVNIISGTAGLSDRSDKYSDRYASMSGTSMATPHISGLIACMYESHRANLGKNLTREEIMQMLKQRTSQKSNISGYGILDWNIYRDWMSTEHGLVI